MLLNSLFLALSSSIDSLGIGITYGIKNTKISLAGKIILFIISITITYLSLFSGNILKMFLSDSITKIIGSIILIFIGIYICYKALKKDVNSSNIFNDPISSDFDNSNIIDSKESLFLAIALSLDSLCIGIGGSIVNMNLCFFPILVSIFQLFFLSIGTLLGKNINKLCNLPDNIWSTISGVLLIIIGLVKFFV